MPHKRAKRSVREAEIAKKGYNLAPKSAGGLDDTPRSASRILNGWNVQNAFRASGRTTSEDTGERKKKRKRRQESGEGTEKPGSRGPSAPQKVEKKRKPQHEETEVKDGRQSGPDIPRILPHETLGDYNRRVESVLRPGVSKAIKEAKSVIEAQDRSKKTKGKGRDTSDDGNNDAGGDAGSDNDGVPSRRGQKRKQEFDTAPTHKRLNDIAQAPPTLLHLKKGPQKATSVWGAKGQGMSGLSAGQERILAEERERVVKRYREMKAEREAAKGQGTKGPLA